MLRWINGDLVEDGNAYSENISESQYREMIDVISKLQIKNEKLKQELNGYKKCNRCMTTQLNSGKQIDCACSIDGTCSRDRNLGVL